MNGKPNIRSYTREELKSFFIENGEKGFRADQVYQWLWKKHVHDFQEMTDLGKALRTFLDTHFSIHTLTEVVAQHSADKTIKSAQKLFDGKILESVLIPSGKRMTGCVSSQVGCSLDCKFCATAALKLMRNLTPDEIYDQVVALDRQAKAHYQTPLSNIVMMGMGEPLLNYKNVMAAIDLITSPDGLGMSPRRITLSTSGINKMIRKLGDDEVPFHLAVSLHAATNEKRSKIMSINDSNPLEELAEALKYFYQKTKTRITYEYIVFRDFNDGTEDAAHLARFCQHVPCKVNIIEYNPIDGGTLQQTSPERLKAFIQVLEKRHIIVNVRRSRGKDIDAACGQLANKH